MEAQFENTNEHYNDKFVENNSVPNEIPITTNSMDAYTHYVTHDTSPEILSNNEVSSYNTQEYTMDTSVSYPDEAYPKDSVDNCNVDGEAKEKNQSEFHGEPHASEVQKNIQMDTSEASHNVEEQVSSNVEEQCSTNEVNTDHKIEEIPAENLPVDLEKEGTIIVEEPSEVMEENNTKSVQEMGVEEIQSGPLPEYENVENQEGNVFVTEIDESGNTNIETIQNVETVVEQYQDDLESQTEKLEESLQEKVEVQNLEENIDAVEGDLVIEEVPSEHGESVHHETVEYDGISEIKDIEHVDLQNTQGEEIPTQENVIQEPVLTDTVVIEAVEDSHETSGAYTIIETADTIEFTSDNVEELATDQTFSDDLNLTTNESLTDDSGITEEVIILQTEESVDDPQPVEEQKYDQTAAQQSEKSPRKPASRKGRKATYDIPMHILGHDINKPVEPVINGRPLPKPRLGVKVPYRNLTSQIVSKAEIEKEIIERGRLKMEQNKGEMTFARSLTQRLAKKIAPPGSENSSNADEDQVKTENEENLQQSGKGESATEQTSIQNDSDLLAILEGDEDEPVLPVVHKETAVSPQVDESSLKALEREIALQQLSELPHQTPKQIIFRGKHSKQPTTVITPVSTSKQKTLTVVTPKIQHIIKEKNKENSTSSSPVSNKEHIDLSPKKQPTEIEPQVKINMVLKTYSRKRKISEPQDPLKDYPPPKKPVYDSSNDSDIKIESPDIVQTTSPVYITKSSRVIKKKVIWDPDEVPVRSPKLSVRSIDVKSPIPKSSPASKIVKSEKSSNTEKTIEKKVVAEKKIVEKVEKTQNEKKVEKVQSEKKIEKTPTKKSISPKSNSNSKPKKVRSEIDRLLMDEGAVKMLYELNNTDEMGTKKKKTFYSVERAQKEIIKKANLLKNELEQTSTNDSQISLRKKEALIMSSISPSPTRSGPILERKMSKDSTRSSVHTPPGSPFPHGQASMLIRRRSSSSLSSSDTEIEFKPREMRRRTDTPKVKKPKKSEDEKLELDETSSIKSGETPKKSFKATVLEIKSNQYKSFTIKKTGKHVSIDLNYIDEKCYFTTQVLGELTSVLRKFSKDKDCNILTVTSSGKAFCLGLDYSCLVAKDEETRRDLATQLSERVKDFLICLLHFPKVLVACIQGACVGLGVTMLPLFDMVIASDSTTFTTPYASLGCIGEGGFLLGLSNLVSHGLASELLYTGQTLTADEGFRRGLITKLCWPEKYKATLMTIVASIASSSKQSLESMKKQLRFNKTRDIEAALNSEKKIWVEHWTSVECQEKFSELASAF